MYSSVTPIIIKAVTPVHAGIGREIGLVDMPIQRESHTGIPKIEGSTLKGTMREVYRLNKKDGLELLFGRENGNKIGDDGAGLVGFSDAKLLLYPVKSLEDLFTYITCPYLINKFIEDINFSNNHDQLQLIENNIKEGQAIVLSKKAEPLLNGINVGGNIILDVYEFKETPDKDSLKESLKIIRELLLDRLDIKRKIAMLCDEDFIELISLNREIITRNKINYETGIVEDGKLFTEEYLPAESMLYSLLLVNGILEGKEFNKELVKQYKNEDLPKVLQIGGNKTIGKGIVKISKYLDGGGQFEPSKKY